MPIEDRNLQPGTVLVGRHKHTEHRCEVVETPEGVRYQVDRGEMFKSPSSAAKHVTGGAVNGWVFWSIAGTETPKREPKAKAEKPAKKAAANGKAKKSARKRTKPKAMRTAASGDSYACGVCDETFKTQKAAVAHTITHTA